MGASLPGHEKREMKPNLNFAEFPALSGLRAKGDRRGHNGEADLSRRHSLPEQAGLTPQRAMPMQSSTGLERLSFRYAGEFSSLLPLGVITLSSFHGLPGPGPLAPDGWNWASPLPWISSRRGSREADLEFLTNNDFIRATYRLEGPGRARLRVYVLPEDCEWYLVREPQTEFRGRALLKKLWDLVLDARSEAWHFSQPGYDQVSRFPAVMDDDDVSLNLSDIFNSLPSPKPDLELSQSASLLIRTILESVLEDDGVPGFKSQLYQYQRESVWKMLQRELLPRKRLDPRLRKWSGPTGIVAWINLSDMTFWRNQQYVDDVPGGILCEEMGTGKTVSPPTSLFGPDSSAFA